MRRLVDSGASVNFHDDQWLSPLHIAAGVTRTLQPHSEPAAVVSSASTEDNVDVELVELLVRAKAAMRARDHSRWTALHYAVRVILGNLDSRICFDSCNRCYVAVNAIRVHVFMLLGLGWKGTDDRSIAATCT